MIGLLMSMLLMGLAWVPRRVLSALRRRGARTRVVELTLSESPGALEMAGIIEEIRSFGEHGTCRGLLLRWSGASIGWADGQALADALARARDAGLLVVVYLEGAGNVEMLVASAADRVWLAPASEVNLLGVGADLAFFGAALRRLGVEVELLAAGAYKSYGETFARAFPTPENREATLALVTDLQAQLTERLARGRRIGAPEVEALMARAPLAAEDAVEAGLADGLRYADQVEREVEELIGAEVRWTTLGRVARWRRWQARLDRVGRRVAPVVVVHLEGGVTQREAGRGRSIDADRVVPALHELAERDDVRAVVLAIDSPGGGALPSDDIAAAVARLARYKPVVAALQGVAASGGYYIAAPCSEIVAQPGTITGSIGVVGGKLVLGGAAGRLGVFHERVAAGPNGGVYGPWDPFTDDQRARFQASLGRAYRRFLGVVAAGRRRSLESVEPVAQGRVWTGRQALDAGLVDHLGGLDVAVARAASLASLRRVRVAHLDFPPPRLHALTRLLQARMPLAKLVMWRDLMDLTPLPALLLEAPGQPLAMLPWRIDGAWSSPDGQSSP